MEQISEEFAREKLLKMSPDKWDEFYTKSYKDVLINYWKEKGYIKQSSLEQVESLNIFLFNYLKSTGYKPEDIVMCQQNIVGKNGYQQRFWFEPKNKELL